MNLRLAQVVAVRPASRTVDLVMLDDGSRVADAQVASGMVASDSGFWAVPSVPKPSREAAAGGRQPPGHRTLLAVVVSVFGRPIVLGFLQPLGGTANTAEQDLAFYKHPSGATFSVAPDGTVQVKTGATDLVLRPDGQAELSCATLTINGDVVLHGRLDADTEVTANDIPLTTHRHTGVQSGGGTSGTPVA